MESTRALSQKGKLFSKSTRYASPWVPRLETERSRNGCRHARLIGQEKSEGAHDCRCPVAVDPGGRDDHPARRLPAQAPPRRDNHGARATAGHLPQTVAASVEAGRRPTPALPNRVCRRGDARAGAKRSASCRLADRCRKLPQIHRRPSPSAGTRGSGSSRSASVSGLASSYRKFAGRIGHRGGAPHTETRTFGSK